MKNSKTVNRRQFTDMLDDVEELLDAARECSLYDVEKILGLLNKAADRIDDAGDVLRMDAADENLDFTNEDNIFSEPTIDEEVDPAHLADPGLRWGHDPSRGNWALFCEGREAGSVQRHTKMGVMEFMPYLSVQDVAYRVDGAIFKTYYNQGQKPEHLSWVDDTNWHTVDLTALSDDGDAKGAVEQLVAEAQGLA
jgi:hypothetical protein